MFSSTLVLVSCAIQLFVFLVAFSVVRVLCIFIVNSSCYSFISDCPAISSSCPLLHIVPHILQQDEVSILMQM